VLSALNLLVQPSTYPVLVMCNLGRHRTGTVIGCLRKLQRWNLSAILDEYRRYAGPKVRVMNEQVSFRRSQFHGDKSRTKSGRKDAERRFQQALLERDAGSHSETLSFSPICLPSSTTTFSSSNYSMKNWSLVRSRRLPSFLRLPYPSSRRPEITIKAAPSLVSIPQNYLKLR